ncbi:hypothetical protein ACHAWU_007893 [Discostella pseudostelligera]|uniref:Glycosyltransferase family 31 protein n=1 Tax=Discostella pseudostelligera TaxID=259834 RepID=A0ABD3MB45_9STRA
MATQRRGRNNNVEVVGADNHSHGVPSSSNPSLRRQHPSPIFPKGVSLVCLVFVFFLVVIIVEFTAYRLLSIPSYSISTSNTVATISSKSNSDSDTTHSTHDNVSKIVKNQNVRHKTAAVSQYTNPSPTQQPTITANAIASYEPTATTKGKRVVTAIKQHHRNAQYWKTHTPDPVPPLDSSSTSTDDDTINAKTDEQPPIIAYVVTLTKCKGRASLDGAAVLLHSIRRNSYGWDPNLLQQLKDANDDKQDGDKDAPIYGGKGGRYRYRAYVIVDPSASPSIKGAKGECARYLQKIGYTVLHRPPLVPLFKLADADDEDGDANGSSTNAFYDELKKSGYVGMQRPNHGPTARHPNENPNKLRFLMHDDGCCGYSELLKLHVYGLVEHELAVHLDLDSLLLRPMDDLFDVMLAKGDIESRRSKLMSMMAHNLPRTKDVDISKPIDAAFTRDYNSVKNPSLDAPVGYQGGFLAVRPNIQVLERYRSILQRGEFLLNPRLGWGGKHGGFYGDLTFQGILPYYYEDVAPALEGVGHNEIELNRCIYNQMADNPRKSTYKFPRATPLDPKAMGFRDTKICRDGREDCSDTDCQRTHPKESITTHFTFAGKPWDCSEGNAGTVAHDTCIGLLREWYGIRRELENWWLSPPTSADKSRPYYWRKETIANVHESRRGALDADGTFLGYCDEHGSGGYRRLVEPDEPK